MLLQYAIRNTQYAIRNTIRRGLKRGIAWRYRVWPADPGRRYRARVAGIEVEVLPEVFHPAWYFTSGFMARALLLDGLVPAGGRVLDMGTGSGILALAAARRGGIVTAVDINPAAVECARANVSRHGLDTRVEVREGDMFAAVAGERFDLVISNPPYFRGEPASRHEQALLAGPGLEWIARFAASAGAHLAPGGRLLVVIGDAAELDEILAIFAAQGWRSRTVARRDIWHELLYIFEFRPTGGRGAA